MNLQSARLLAVCFCHEISAGIIPNSLGAPCVFLLLQTKRDVEMAGYCEAESRSSETSKIERGQYPAIIGQQRIFRGNFCRGTLWVVPTWQNRAILPAQVANHRISFILPARSRSLPYNNLKISFSIMQYV